MYKLISMYAYVFYTFRKCTKCTLRVKTLKTMSVSSFLSQYKPHNIFSILKVCSQYRY